DFIFLDAEHTPFAPNVLQDMIKTLNYNSEGATLTVVRLPTHGADWTSWALDAGASAVVFPHTETAEQAKKVVANCRFAPLGHRSFPPFATIPGHTDGTPRDGMTILDVYNENAAVIMQIESAEGVKNAEAICAVEGVDAIMIGTGDLRMSLGLMPGVDGPEPIFQEALATIEAAAAKYNLPILGFALGGPMAENRLNRGWQLLMMSADTLALVIGQSGPLKETRAVVESFEKGVAGKN
ncbi:Pyruvate/Phosphoenolpyruvate kinase-like domain-containing protein, partial [Leucosporidium creatinivorum]